MKARLLPLCLLLGTLPAVVHAGDNSPIGKKIENFVGRDFRGKEVALADLSDSKLVVVAFLGTECPLAKLYGPRLAELQRDYAEQGVAFIGVDANRQDLGTEIAHYAREASDRISAVEGRGERDRRSVRSAAYARSVRVGPGSRGAVLGPH